MAASSPSASRPAPTSEMGFRFGLRCRRSDPASRSYRDLPPLVRGRRLKCLSLHRDRCRKQIQSAGGDRWPCIGVIIVQLMPTLWDGN